MVSADPRSVVFYPMCRGAAREIGSKARAASLQGATLKARLPQALATSYCSQEHPL